MSGNGFLSGGRRGGADHAGTAGEERSEARLTERPSHGLCHDHGFAGAGAFLLHVKLYLASALSERSVLDWRHRGLPYLIHNEGLAPSPWRGFSPAEHPTGQTR